VRFTAARADGAGIEAPVGEVIASEGHGAGDASGEEFLVENATMTPIAATLKILGNTVPYLIGVAVVRQQPGANTVLAEFGRVPWLHDRRLTSLDLPEDQLPANQLVLLDWPLPHQAEWVGAPPRLLIARLVSFDRLVGVLLGTLITREQLQPQAQEALELSCQLIASVVATDALVRAGERQSRRLRLLNEVQQRLSATLDPRQLGRILREVINEVAEPAAFAVSLFHPERDEVAYRYRVADVDAVASELGRRPVDDGPLCRAIRRGERWTSFSSEIEMPIAGDPSGRTERRNVSVLQIPVVSAHASIGVVTLQTFQSGGFREDVRDVVVDIVDAAANYFAHARALGLERAPLAAPSRQAADTAPVAGPVELPITEGSGNGPSQTQPSETIALDATMPEAEEDGVLRSLLARCEKEGIANAFVVRADLDLGVLRGERTSGSETMRHVDDATGISRGTFIVSVDDRFNAIARACREARPVSVAWLFEVLQPLVAPEDALVLERLAGGGRCTVVPLVASGAAIAAVVAGPASDELSPEIRGRLAELATEAAARLTAIRERSKTAEGTPDQSPPAALRVLPAAG